MGAAPAFCTVLAAASFIASPVSAFVSPPTQVPSCKAAAFSGPRFKTSLAATTLDTPPPAPELPLPPRDETFNPLATLRELLAAPNVPEGRYDRVGSASGGTWRSIIIGIIPSTVRIVFFSSFVFNHVQIFVKSEPHTCTCRQRPTPSPGRYLPHVQRLMIPSSASVLCAFHFVDGTSRVLRGNRTPLGSFFFGGSRRDRCLYVFIVSNRNSLCILHLCRCVCV